MAPRGFTLIELLVVIVVIATMTGVAVLSIGNRDASTLRGEARRLQQFLKISRDEAMYRYRNYGLAQNGKSYRLLAYNDLSGRWESPANRLFKPHRLPAPLHLSLSVEGELVLPEGETEGSFNSTAEGSFNSTAEGSFNTTAEGSFRSTESTEDTGSPLKRPPQLLLLSSGEITPFEIHLRTAEDSPLTATLSSDGFSPITLVFSQRL